MRVFVTGGAGFIGCNLAAHHIHKADEVVVFDDLSRTGTAKNVDWLKALGGDRFTFIHGDVRDHEHVVAALPRDADIVYHMAGQVAVTTSVQKPREDFEVNALGTFNVLDAVRVNVPEAVFFYASTNKVYGELADVRVVEKPSRYDYADCPDGISEEQPLSFHSPYGCSKGCADQYVRDYARIYGLRTVVFRQSCIYGTRQFGIEDQGWVAHFCIAAAQGRPLTICGDGKQVRDILWIGDLVAAFAAAYRHIDTCAGEVFNIGGGPENTMSVWYEFKKYLVALSGRPVDAAFDKWRSGDQKIYMSDIRKAKRVLGWAPTVDVQQGITRLWQWVVENPGLF